MIGILQYEFMRNAFIVALLASVACGIVGVYVVVKRIVFISGGIAHAAFGGIGLGYFLGLDPVMCVIPFSIVSALGMGVVSRKTRIPEDTAIGILWATGMAFGIILVALTPGYFYGPDLFEYLFGNILTVTYSDLILTLILDVVIIVVVALYNHEFEAISFDEEYATAIGLPAERLYLLLLCLVALTVVALIRVVGVILVIALLTLPPAISRLFSTRMRDMITRSIAISATVSIAGLLLAYATNLPSGATIVMLSAGVFMLTYISIRIHARGTPV